LISCSSSTASSAPATSAKVTLGSSFDTRLALALPNCMTRLPPPCMVFMTKKKAATSRMNGSSVWTRVHQTGSLSWSTLTSTVPASRISWTTLGESALT
jgi:hypothetical protein